MNKQVKKLILRKEHILTINAGTNGYPADTLKIVVGTGVGGGPHLVTSIGPACPTLLQKNTVGC